MTNPANIAFIIGTGRCGTSLLGQMLNSNSKICVPPELQLIFECDENGNRLIEEVWTRGDCDFSAEELSSIIKRCCPHKLELFFDYQGYCKDANLASLSESKLLTDFYSAIAKSHNKSWLIEQTPWYGQRIDLLVKLFPDAKFIHMVRDGRDVALSFSRTPWWHKSVGLNLGRWAREIKKISVDASVYLDVSRYIEVKYEDLVLNPKYELSRVCEFLGVDFEEPMVDATNFINYDDYCNFDVKSVSSQAYGDWKKEKSSPVFSENIQAWRRVSNIFSFGLTDEINNALLRFGYLDSDEKCVNAEQYHFNLGLYASTLEMQLADLNSSLEERSKT